MTFNKALFYAILLIIFGYLLNNAQKLRNTATYDEILQQDTNQKQESIIFNRADFGIFQYAQRNSYPKKIFIKVDDGQRLISVEDIVYCENIKNEKHLNLLLRNEAEFEKEIIKNTSLTQFKINIDNPAFIYKNNKSNIININFVEKIIEQIDYNNNYIYFVELSNGKKVSLPTAKKDDFYRTVETYYSNY